MKTTRWLTLLVLPVLLVLVSGVGAQDGGDDIRLWYPAPVPTLGPQVIYTDHVLPAAPEVGVFNRQHPPYVLVDEAIPRAGYLDHLRAHSLAGDLPCVLGLESYYTASFAASGDLRALPTSTLPADLLPPVMDQGGYENSPFSVAQSTTTLALWGNRALLEAAGVRLPTVEQPWTRAEFDTVLAALATVVPEGGYALDLNLTAGDEWLFRALTPFLWSFGGHLIDRAAYTTATGFINSPAAVAFGTWWQGLLRAGYVSAQTGAGPVDFQTGRVGLSLGGPWQYETYQAALGRDLVLLPLPDLGTGPRTTSWGMAWAISTRCDRTEGAAAFLDFLLAPDQVRAAATANSALPARVAVLARNPQYKVGGELHVFFAQLQAGWAQSLPGTRVTPVIVSAWGRALRTMADGAEVQAALDTAAGEIDAAIANLHEQATRE